jgi:hypothetical protein
LKPSLTDSYVDPEICRQITMNLEMEVPVAENETTPYKMAHEEFLRLARPRLICRVDEEGNSRSKFAVSERKCSREEVVSEGYDPDESPLGCPVYWRVVRRGNERFYCSTFLATCDQVMKGWGVSGLAYVDRATGNAPACIEMKLRRRVP